MEPVPVTIYSHDALRDYVSNIPSTHGAIARKLVQNFIQKTLDREQNHRCTPRTKSEKDLQTKTLRKKFILAQKRIKAYEKQPKGKRPAPFTPRLFIPDQKLESDIKIVMEWVGTFTKNMGPGDAFYLCPAIESKLESFATLESLAEHARTNTSLLSNLEIEEAKSNRTVLPEEQQNHIRYETQLAPGYHLIRIKTQQGLKKAAQKANNCWYGNKYPTPSYPHRKRLNHQQRFGYYQVRDDDGHSIANIVLDFENGQYAYEGNHRYDANGEKITDIEPRHEFLISYWQKYFYECYPDFFTNAPYGSRPHTHNPWAPSHDPFG